uniref:Uncharacterized protein n=1 Tax=Lactuca sativa TaxID=4236 RepID=A0A9R1XHY8_LACSA|nr:hypothetical protein LSAT_V11C300107540 [Lactuca sativa]
MKRHQDHLKSTESLPPSHLADESSPERPPSPWDKEREEEKLKETRRKSPEVTGYRCSRRNRHILLSKIRYFPRRCSFSTTSEFNGVNLNKKPERHAFRVGLT